MLKMISLMCLVMAILGCASVAFGAGAILVNAGGTTTITDTAGNWLADTISNSSFTVSGGKAGPECSSACTISNTNVPAFDPKLFQTQRYGSTSGKPSSFSYSFNVAPGTYAVSLYFAEAYVNKIGARQFNVTINGAAVLTNFDIYKEAGQLMYKAVAETFQVPAATGKITILFSPGLAQNPMVNAIAVQPATSPLSVTTSSIPDATLNTSYSATLTASGGTPPYTWSSSSLPAGLTLSPSGTISGSPSELGNFSVNFYVQDSSGVKQTSNKTLSLTVISGGKVIGNTLFGMSINNPNNSSHFPSVDFGMLRIWDSGNVQWPRINTAANTYDWSNLDTVLAKLKSAGVSEVFYTMSRTPQWASSNPSDTTCNYYGTGGNTSGLGAPGQCHPPSDLNTDGTGSDQIWKNWVRAIATHANDATYLQTHAHIRYWEPWNEFDRSSIIGNGNGNYSFQGTYAQLVRMTEDARCIILGTGVIHNYPSLGQTTNCTATPIDSSAKIVMPSSHSQGAGTVAIAQNFLYCNASPKAGSYCNTGSGGANAVDIINYHMKPGNVSTVSIETETTTMYNNGMKALQAAELAKPFWNGESGYSGFANAWGTGAYADADMQASFVPRYLMLSWSLGVASINWYTWDISNYLWTSNGPTKAAAAWQTSYDWLYGASLSSCAVTGTIWKCSLTKNGVPSEALWDEAGTCSNGTCTTLSVSVGSQWTRYEDLAGVTHAISGGAVPVGIKPILLFP